MSFPYDIQLTGGEESTTSSTKEHRYGQRAVTEDGRVFRYCRASTNGVAQPYWGAQDSHSYNTTDLEDCVEGVTVTLRVTGDKLLDTLDSGTHAADFFEDGWAVLTIGSKIQMCRIKSSTAAGASTTLTLYEPLAVDVAVGSQLQIFPSVYSSVERVLGGGDGAKVTVCMPIMTITASHYFWGQTRGPCYGIPSEAFPRGSYESRLVFSYDGSVKLATSGANLEHQAAGYRLFHYSADPTGALIFFYLQIE